MKKNYLILVFVISSFFSVNKVSAQTEPYVGQIVMFAGNFAPRGWALCHGQLMSIQQNVALFSIIGTIYGGDGMTTFKLPDLRSKVPVGTGYRQDDKQLGEQGGSSFITLTNAQMPAHTHQLIGSNAAGNSNLPGGNFLGDTSVLDKEYTSTGIPAMMNPQAIGISGGSQPINIEQPYLGINFIIALEGVFPPRE